MDFSKDEVWLIMTMAVLHFEYIIMCPHISNMS